MEDASHVDMDAWCITVGGVSAFPVDTQAILQSGSGFLRDCGLPTPWVKEIFILFFSKHKVFHARLVYSKNKKKTSYDIVWISSHIKN